MKTIKLLLAAALLSGVTTLALAGPSPQFWAQQSKDQQERIAKNEPKADKDAKACAGCSCCSGCTVMKK